MTTKKDKEISKTRPFTNRQTFDVEISGIKGTVTIPILLSDEQLATYLTYMNEKEGEVTPDEDQIILVQLRRRHESMRHMVLAIDFPGVTMTNYSPKGQHPFPALVYAVGELLDPVLRDALNLPNS